MGSFLGTPGDIWSGAGNRPCLLSLLGAEEWESRAHVMRALHEWGRCSIHKCRIALQPRRRWESPAGRSCSSLCQQIPFNSLLMLVLAPLAELRECRAGIAELELQRMLTAQGVEDCRLPQPALLLRSRFICSAKKDRAPGRGVRFPVPSHPPPQPGFFLAALV